MPVAQHLSVRVPWHDAGWTGTVCRDPLGNSSCILLENIGRNRKDALEVAAAGRSFEDLNGGLPACAGERGGFLSSRDHVIRREHPYRSSAALRGLEEAAIPLPAWAVHGIPFYWLNRQNAEDVLSEQPVADYSQEIEDEAVAALGWTPRWVVHGDNQQALIEMFFADVTPAESLLFFYLKHSPFEDQPRRMLVGAATVTSVALPGRWPTSAPTAFPNHMWETVVRHSLRPDGTGGILLPVQQLASLAAGGIDVRSALAEAPESRREFSYATEHVPPDKAVAALLELSRAAEAAASLGCPVPEVSLTWLDAKLGSAWQRRGPAPGLPAVLARLGFEYPTFSARTVAAATEDGEDPWITLLAAFEGPSSKPEVARLVTSTRRKIWGALDEPVRRALRLLSRFDLTAEEVDRVLDGDTSMPMSLDELFDNPYHLVTCTIDDPVPISFEVVDRGCFPDRRIGDRHPLPLTEGFDDPLDERRVEAALVTVLRRAEADGHTLLPTDDAIERVSQLTVGRPLALSATVLTGLELDAASLDDDPGATWPQLCRAALADGTPAYKLRSSAARREWIRSVLRPLQASPRHDVPADLADTLHGVLGAITDTEMGDRGAEERARVEKTRALEEMYASWFTVLNGQAGTGKTTLVKALAARPEVTGAGLLLLAPTGKARVQLQEKVKVEARTLAQFLSATGRYDGEAGRYVVTGDRGSRQRWGTIVVDEASMLTEDMLAALLDAVVPPQRLILVGDPRQLPPIGAGRPFVDLERAARRKHDGSWPQIASGWAELTVLRRQKGQVRDDLMLSRWFSGDEIPEGFDEVWERLRRGEQMETLRAVAWDGRSGPDVLDAVLTDIFHVQDDGGLSFARSYGAGEKASNGKVYPDFFTAPAGCESWQVLSPVRGRAHGTVELNRHLKRRHRGKSLQDALADGRWRRVPKPLGAEQIVVGDKVVNTRNGGRKSWSRAAGKEYGYVANGELGVVIGQLKSGAMKKAPSEVQVEFSSQRGKRYSYWGGSGDDDSPLELAWALTVHKSQGSEFNKVILMLPAGVRSLSRELLYTALTRQTEQVILCHEGPLDDLLELTRASGSDTARRLTDLVVPPAPTAVTSAAGTSVGILDAGLVHLTGNGVLVRSKNEVIVASILDEFAPGAWSYEQPLRGRDGVTRYPDFTVLREDGRVVYWEHLGMLGDPGYAAAWKRKKQWYADLGVLPAADGGGPAGALVWTDDRSGVEVPAWRQVAAAAIGPMAARPAKAAPKKVTARSRREP
jgi:hypothetical protein